MESIPFPSFERLRVFVRERPIIEENTADVKLHIKTEGDKLVAFSPSAAEGLMYDCDQYFSSTATQDEVFKATGEEAVDLVIQGFSSNIILTGYAETGKTHTLYGNADEPGLLHNTIADLYRRLENQKTDYRASVVMRYWEMDRDLVEDALCEPPEVNGTALGDDKERDSEKYTVFRNSLNCLAIRNLTAVEVPTAESLLDNLNRGSLRRIQRSYERMARWHGFVQLTITTTDRAEGSRVLVRTLTFVHMKGSDRLGAKGIRGDLLREGSRINVSITLLGSAVIHSLEYREKRAAQAATREGHHALIRRSQSFFLECKFSRFMSQLICGHEASYVVGCVSPLEYCGSINTLESLQLFRRLQCALMPIAVISARGRLLIKLRCQEELLGGAAVAAKLYASEGGAPLTEAEEKLLLLYGKAYGKKPKRLASTSLHEERESAMLERSQSRACPRPGEVKTHGTRKRVFLNPSHSAWYEGQWENGKFGGLGLLVQKHSRYRGEFRNGLRDGEGTLWTRADENSPWVRVYQGGWLAGKRDGFGTTWDANGDIYTGEWSADKRQGMGKLFFANGDIVRGEFRNDMCDGRALLLTANGEWHDGYWAAGLREGPGLWCYVARQQYMRGEWVKGICRCGDFYDMDEKVTNEPSGFVPRLGLLRHAEVLEMERQKIRELRAMDPVRAGRLWEDPGEISPPLGVLAESIDLAEFGRQPTATTTVLSVSPASETSVESEDDTLAN